MCKLQINLNSQNLHYIKRPVTERNSLDFIGGPVVKTALPLKGVWIPSLAGQDPNPGFLAIEKNLVFLVLNMTYILLEHREK